MQAAAHNPEFAKKAGIPQSVAREYVAADKHAGYSAMDEQIIPDQYREKKSNRAIAERMVKKHGRS